VVSQTLALSGNGERFGTGARQDPENPVVAPPLFPPPPYSQYHPVAVSVDTTPAKVTAMEKPRRAMSKSLLRGGLNKVTYVYTKVHMEADYGNP
jgi:hypothetical protein